MAKKSDNRLFSFPESELIIHPDGSMYHLKLKPGEVGNTILLVGDPGRVGLISKYFDSIDVKVENREIKTHTGHYHGRRITAMSTGMGTDNIDIIMNELDALFNIDLHKREVKKEKTSLNIIRIGTCGALQAEIAINSFILSEYGLGLDGLLHFYSNPAPTREQEALNRFLSEISYPVTLPRPYLVKADNFPDIGGEDIISGITLTAPGFYAPQGRTLRIPPAFPGIIDELKDFSFEDKKVVNFEMESSALFGLGKLLGHRTLTVCLAVANRETGEYSKDYEYFMDKLIRYVLHRIAGKK